MDSLALTLFESDSDGLSLDEFDVLIDMLVETDSLVELLVDWEVEFDDESEPDWLALSECEIELESESEPDWLALSECDFELESLRDGLLDALVDVLSESDTLVLEELDSDSEGDSEALNEVDVDTDSLVEVDRETRNG